MIRPVIKTNALGKTFVLFFHEYEENGICSNWYKSDFEIDGVKFSCVEQYMMYKKAMLFNNIRIAKEIMAETDPKNMKALGRKVKGLDFNVWDKHKFEIVLTGVTNKFMQNKELEQWLIEAEADYFVEASPFDAIWGIRLSPTDPRCLDVNQWKGENLLGKALMQAREDIVSSKKL